MHGTLDATALIPAFALGELIEICFGDPAFAESLLETFQRDSEAHLEGIRRYTARGDLAAMSKVAHSLQGSAATVTARAVQRVATRIQTASDRRMVLQLPELVEELDREIGHCRDFLSAVRVDDAAPLWPHKEQER